MKRRMMYRKGFDIPYDCYLADEVDKRIAELKAVMKQLRHELWRVDNNHFLLPYTDKLLKGE